MTLIQAISETYYYAWIAYILVSQSMSLFAVGTYDAQKNQHDFKSNLSTEFVLIILSHHRPSIMYVFISYLVW